MVSSLKAHKVILTFLFELSDGSSFAFAELTLTVTDEEADKPAEEGGGTPNDLGEELLPFT